ncbi:phage Gp37/Gp68 family protein [Methylobacterium sp. CCH5-D2]|uniref:DUF5131 family protein n=1 Tax=Methylobacterium sp. CCH5-D2 TaxID=1768765 RepID=UPI00082B0E1D|nr:phage Gp37/Gp68 family protein [Methylobacterium sp. CCH5-D2]
MADHTAIEWTDATWSPLRARNRATGAVGWHCEHVSPGCQRCYAEAFNAQRLGTRLPFKPGHRADVEHFLDSRMLVEPLRWRRPRRIFVCSMTDLFGAWVPDAMIDQVFAVMALSPRHTFQVLTKRSARMRDYCARRDERGRHPSMTDAALMAATGCWNTPALDLRAWPLPNVWLGVSAEDQARANERVPDLLATPAAVRFVSAEPLLGPIDFEAMPFAEGDPRHRWSALTGQAILHATGSFGRPDFTVRMCSPLKPHLDWIIVGGESGPKARPMHPVWPRRIGDACAATGVAFLFKQWGAWVPRGPESRGYPLVEGVPTLRLTDAGADGSVLGAAGDNPVWMQRIGKKAAGRRLDGRLHDAMPEVRP